MRVVKRDGGSESLDINKIHRVLEWAVEGISGVSVSDIEMNSKIQFFNDIKTDAIHDTLIKSAADLISEETPNYQYVAARLSIFQLRKHVLGQYEPIPIKDLVERNVNLDVYDKDLLTYFNDEEWQKLDKIVKHDRDLNFSYVGIKQLEGKYLVQNRRTKQIYETPQYLYILISATIFGKYSHETRFKYIKEFYDDISKQNISLPTPIMAAVRTPSRQFSSCVMIESDDSLDSIATTSHAILRYISRKAGIGIGAGRIRAEGSSIGNGSAVHTGVVPFFKMFQAAVKSCSQGGVRGGAATLNTVLWHREIENILVLKNNKGIEDNRVRRLDYSIHMNTYLIKRFINAEKITLFSPNDVKDMYDAYYKADQSEFIQLYEKYEKDPSIEKTVIPAKELFYLFMNERAETGRIYYFITDNVNAHSAFLEPVRMSNLCQEILIPTKPLNSIDDKDGEIATCILSAYNLGNLKTLDDLEDIADKAVRFLDGVVSYQDYPVKAADVATKRRRSLGIGVINYAYYLAKNGVRYNDEAALKLTHELFEAILYYTLKASNNLAKEIGPCEGFNETKYSQGLLPIDTYKKSIDEFANFELKYDWETLRADIVTHGLRNSCVLALMPSETSSQIANATNGIEPARALVSIKESKDGTTKQVVPEYSKLKNQYDLLWDLPNMDGYIKLVAIMQKFVDQSISANLSYNPRNYPGGKIPMATLLGDFLKTVKYGWNTAYYHNTRDFAGEDVDAGEDECDGACKI